MTDQTSTLHVAIDPSGAETGARAAENAFERMRNHANSTTKFISDVTKSIGGGFVAAFKAIKGAASSMYNHVKNIFGMMKTAGSNLVNAWKVTFGKAAGLIAPLGVIGTVKKVLESGLNYQKFLTTMSVITGSIEGARDQLDWLMDSANRLGISFESAAAPFAKFAAAAKGALPTDEINQIFEAFGEASAALHLNKQEMQGVFLALQQMASKGRVSMEELRLQLAERIPGAMQLAANAMKMSVAELESKVREGAVSTGEFLTPFAKKIHEKFGGAASLASKTAIGAFRRFQNELFNTSQILAHGGLLDALGNAADRIAKWLRDNRVVFKEISQELGRIVGKFTDWLTNIDKEDVTGFFEGMRDTLKSIYEWVDKIIHAVPEIKKKAESAMDVAGTGMDVMGAVLNPMKAVVDGFLDGNALTDWMGGMFSGEAEAAIAPVKEVKDQVKELNKELQTTSDIVDELINNKSAAPVIQEITDAQFNASIRRALSNFERDAFKSELEKIQKDMDKEQQNLIKYKRDALGGGGPGSQTREFREGAASRYAESLKKLLELQIDYNEELFKISEPRREIEDQIKLIGKEGLAREYLTAELEKEADMREAASKYAGKDLDVRQQIIEQVAALKKHLAEMTMLYEDSARIDPVVNATRELSNETEVLNYLLDNGVISVNSYADAMHELKVQLIEAKVAMGEMSLPDQVFAGASDAIYDMSQDVFNVYDNMKSVTTNAFNSMADAIVNFAQTGKFSFKDFARSVMLDITMMLTKMVMMQALCTAFPQACAMMNFGSSVTGAVSAANAPRNAVGSDRVANDGLAYVHKDEAIIPAKQAESYRAEKRKPADAPKTEEKQKTPMNIINLLDPSLVRDFLLSPDGHDVVLNVIKSNPSAVKRYIS